MSQDDVLQVFRQQADMLGAIQDSQRDIILALAEVLAEAEPYMQKRHFDTLVHIGAVMYQEGLAQFNARSETDTLMEASVDDHADKT
jgi:hypothetical protein